MILFSRPHKI